MMKATKESFDKALKQESDNIKKGKMTVREHFFNFLKENNYSKEQMEGLRQIIKGKTDKEIKQWLNELQNAFSNKVFHNGFIEYYEKYQYLRTNAPTQFATHLIIQLMGHVIGHKAVHPFMPSDIKHNNYIALVGDSTVSRKSTAQDMAEKCLGIGLEYLILSKSFSPEGLIKELSNQPHGIAFLGEFSTYLRALKTGSYLAGYREISNELFNFQMGNYRRMLSKKEYNIENPYFSQSVTSTPSQLENNLTEGAISDGFLPRFLLIYGETMYRNRTKVPMEAIDMEKNIREILWKLYDIGKNTELIFELTENAVKEFNKLDKALSENKEYAEIKPFAGRYAEYIIVYADMIRLSKEIMRIGINNFSKIKNLQGKSQPSQPSHSSHTSHTSHTQETLSAMDVMNITCDTGDTYVSATITVDETDIAEAWGIIKPCILYAKSLMKLILEDKKIAKVIRVFQKYAYPDIKHNTCLRYSHMKLGDFMKVIETLIERGDVKIAKTDEDDKPLSYRYVGDE